MMSSQTYLIKNEFLKTGATVRMSSKLTESEKLFKNYKLFPNYGYNDFRCGYPKAKNVIVYASNKNHMYYTLCGVHGKFPSLQNLFIASHPCEPAADYLFPTVNDDSRVIDPRKEYELKYNIFILDRWGMKYFMDKKNKNYKEVVLEEGNWERCSTPVCTKAKNMHFLKLEELFEEFDKLAEQHEEEEE